jgi:hypothetical protein
MECPWEYDAWKPTAGGPEALGPWEKPSKAVPIRIQVQSLRPTNESQEFTKLKTQLLKDAKAVRLHPHEPKFRFARGNALLELGYPELAAGDFEKTPLLFEHGLDYFLGKLSLNTGKVYVYPVCKSGSKTIAG